VRRPLAIFIVTGTAATLLTFVGLQPRLGHTFPSMIDDWAAISRSPHQIGEVLKLRSPEGIRYRPGFIAWNYLQWHTFGGPGNLVAPSVWGVLRVIAFVFGLVGAAFVLVGRTSSRRGDTLVRALLAGGAALVVTTMPATATNLARYGPQEPLMVGLMCAGGALMALTVRRCLDGTASMTQTWVWGLIGLLLWAGGISQKETSVCALVLLPFLWLGTRAWRTSVTPPTPGRRRAVWGLLTLALVAFVPMFVRVVQLSLADLHVYHAEPNKNVVGTTLTQLSHMTSAIGSPLGVLLLIGAVGFVALSLASRRFDWVPVGLLLTGLASLAFAAQTSVSTSRYFLPLIALSALAIARLASTLTLVPMLAVTSVLALAGLMNVHAAQRNVQEWVGGELAQEQFVRAVAGLRAGGCTVRVAGTDVELIMALPILEPYAHQRPSACVPGERFLALIYGSVGSKKSADGSPALAACGADRVALLETRVGRLLRCEPAASAAPS
jgi:hypothetical protein